MGEGVPFTTAPLNAPASLVTTGDVTSVFTYDK